MSRDLYARAKSVFVRAVDLPAGARRAFVEQECRGDAALRAEVESLLAHHHTQTLIASLSTTAPLRAAKTPASEVRSLFRRAASAVVRLRPQGQMALGALAAMLLSAAMGVWVHSGTEATLRQILGEKLRGMLDADVAAVDLWVQSKKARVREWASDRTLCDRVAELLRSQASDASQSGPASLQARLDELAEAHPDFILWDRTQTVVADSSRQDDAVARSATPLGARLLSHVFHGETVLCIERPSQPLFRPGQAPADAPLLSILCPVEGDDDRIVAALMIRNIDRDGELDRILGYVHTGESGECYAFDREGIMLTESRFNEQLVRIGLIPPNAKARSATVVSLRDPGADLTAGYKPDRPFAVCPLTSMAAHAVAGEDGIDLDGYRDYRGVEVIGAWKWLPKYEFGMAIEIDRWEAYAPLKYLDIAFGVLLVVLGATLAAVAFSWLSIARLRREVSAARQLGQYTLEELIGEGGMGQVYRARHLLLKRPTAVKVLKPDLSTPQMLARFEREVQLSSQLTHPNTIEIFDYGRTPDDVFYYAMEYIDGLNLAQVVALTGPLPAARVVHILRQICGSLREAHALGLLHRDIKPQNIMLCCRGGESDVVKVLDFGLAKRVSSDKTTGATSGTGLVGTPLYMSPERLLSPGTVDARSDIYSVGAVGFKLLTGEDVFFADNESTILAQIVEGPIPRPSEHAAIDVPRELDDLIASCLSKRSDDRPASAAHLLAALDAMSLSGRWSQQEAFEWWRTVGGSAAAGPDAAEQLAARAESRVGEAGLDAAPEPASLAPDGPDRRDNGDQDERQHDGILDGGGSF
ncbi:MAG TPA: protein kinase [Pirellulales bacterium]|nr:protein kinase [Pirellulales bacterium]